MVQFQEWVGRSAFADRRFSLPTTADSRQSGLSIGLRQRCLRTCPRLDTHVAPPQTERPPSSPAGLCPQPSPPRCSSPCPRCGRSQGRPLVLSPGGGSPGVRSPGGDLWDPPGPTVGTWGVPTVGRAGPFTSSSHHHPEYGLGQTPPPPHPRAGWSGTHHSQPKGFLHVGARPGTVPWRDFRKNPTEG